MNSSQKTERVAELNFIEFYKRFTQSWYQGTPQMSRSLIVVLGGCFGTCIEGIRDRMSKLGTKALPSPTIPQRGFRMLQLNLP